MHKLTKKTLATPLISMLALVALFGFGGKALADSNHKHLIRPIGSNDIGSKAISLPLKWSNWKNKSVDAVIRLTNMRTGREMLLTYDTHLNHDGRTNILITGLRPGTWYKLRARIAKENNHISTGYSDSKKVMTKILGAMNPTAGSNAKIETAGEHKKN